MKSKAKLQKIKEKGKAPKMNLPAGWFLMARNEVSVTELRALFPEDADIEVWVDAGIMEIVMGEKNSMDIESISTNFGDPYSDSFVAENAVKSIYYISFKPDQYEVAKGYLKTLSNGVDGFVCGDTEDFMPRI